VFNYFVTGRPFEKIVFQNHLPWVFQFGKDDDPKALLVVFGQLVSTPHDARDRPGRRWMFAGWRNVIDNTDGLLQFYDLSGNPSYVGDKEVVAAECLPTYHLREEI
jgi:hypothetical protein